MELNFECGVVWTRHVNICLMTSVLGCIFSANNVTSETFPRVQEVQIGKLYYSISFTLAFLVEVSNTCSVKLI